MSDTSDYVPTIDQKMRDAGYTARPMPSRDPDHEAEQSASVPTDKLLEAANRLAYQLSSAAFNAGVEDAGDAWTRQEKTAIKQNQTLASLLNAISALAAQAERQRAPTPPQGEGHD